MNTKENNSSKFTFALGIAGCIAGIILAFGDNKVIGISGAIASAGLAYKGYLDLKQNQKDTD